MVELGSVGGNGVALEGKSVPVTTGICVRAAVQILNAPLIIWLSMHDPTKTVGDGLSHQDPVYYPCESLDGDPDSGFSMSQCDLL